MAKTVFAITADGEDIAFPNNSGYPVAKEGGLQNIARYTSLGPGEDYQYPLSNDNFNATFVRFKFLDAYAALITGAPTIKIKTPPQFNVSSIASYIKGEAIFGNQDAYTAAAEGALKQAQAEGGDGFDADSFVMTAAAALQYSLSKGLKGALGFLGSAGLSNVSQYEFATRQALNPMAQMLYKGPEFRRYALPFMMRPRNKGEAFAIKKIVQAFRLASAPSVPSTNDTLLGQGQAFVFGYPHLLQFDVVFLKPAGGADFLYRSKPCVIESVVADYGGQKMTFHEDGYPTETSLNLNLIEIQPRVLGDEQEAARDPSRKLA